MVKIRSLQKSDYPQWLPLWTANNIGQIDDAITAQTWARICDESAAVYGLGAFDGDVLHGLLHYILHPVTGALNHACYMQDVFVNEPHRGQGLAKRLIWELADIGKREQWARLYWLAEASNEAAQNLYKTLGVRLDFTLHVMPLKEF